MGKMKLGSGVSSNQPEEIEIVEPDYVIKYVQEVIPKPVFEVVEVPEVVEKPVIKHVHIDIPMPVYNVVEDPSVIIKPQYIVQDYTETVIKPVFNVKQELQILDRLQDRIESSVQKANAKLDELDSKHIEIREKSIAKLESELKHIKSMLYLLAFASILSTIVLIIR
jgi:hypothetical protein